MKNMNLWLSALVLAAVPLFTTQALIVQPNVQFKTFEQIQADALEKLNAQEGTLSERDLRQRRLLNFTRDNDTSGTDRDAVGEFETYHKEGDVLDARKIIRDMEKFRALRR